MCAYHLFIINIIVAYTYASKYYIQFSRTCVIMLKWNESTHSILEISKNYFTNNKVKCLLPKSHYLG